MFRSGLSGTKGVGWNGIVLRGTSRQSISAASSNLSFRNGLWIALLSPSVEEGIVGLGDSVEVALRAFDAQYNVRLRPPSAERAFFVRCAMESNMKFFSARALPEQKRSASAA